MKVKIDAWNVQFERIGGRIDLELRLSLVNWIVQSFLVFNAEVACKQGADALLGAVVLDLQSSDRVLEDAHRKLIAFVKELLA